MSVAIVMSTYNEERYVDRALDAIADQTVPCDVIVVDGGSSDGTVARLREWEKRCPRLRVVSDGRRRSLPEALNVALSMTSQPLVAKVDARTFVAADFIERAAGVFEKERGVACVGGRPEQRGETSFGEALARARTSRFGVGASGYADARHGRVDVDSVQCGIYRRELVEAVGGFDPVLQFGEDEELNWRLRRAGWRIVRDHAIRFEYVTRPTWRSAFRQYRNYGRARIDVWRKHRDFLRPHHLVPALAVAIGAALLAGSFASRPLRVATGIAASAYAGGALIASAKASRGKLRLVPQIVGAFAALHLGYGIGLLEGIARRADS